MLLLVVLNQKSKIKWQPRELNGGNQITSPAQWHVIPKVAWMNKRIEWMVLINR